MMKDEIAIGTQLQWAWAELESTSDFNMHSNYGTFKVVIPVKGGPVTITTKEDQYFKHGLIMWISWFVLGIIMISTTRWFVYVSTKA
jgi:hypothetical protein